MARLITIFLCVGGMLFLAGCGYSGEGKGQLMPARTTTSLARVPRLDVSGAKELELVEHVATNRQAYRQGLELLVDYYTKGGNDMKLTWSKRELDALNAMPQYRYIIQAEVAGSELEARDSIPEADNLYRDGEETYKRALLVVFVDERALRVALDKFNTLIGMYPSSNKIDDAAFRAGQICEYFGDYSIAALYYKRAFQWDQNTIYPARYKAARLLDFKLNKRDEALELYRQALEKESRHYQYMEIAKRRVDELTRTAR